MPPTLMCCPKHWIDYLAAFLTPTIAITLALVAFLQWRTTERQRKHQIFDRYLENYHLVSAAIASVFQKGFADDHVIETMWRARDDSRLYLSETVVEFVEQLHKDVLKSATINERIATLDKESSELSDLQQQRTDLFTTITTTKPHIVYRPYMESD